MPIRARSRVTSLGTVAVLCAGAVMLTGSPAWAHGTCVVSSPSGGASYSGGEHYASGRINCTSSHTYYAIEVCIQVLRPVLATFTDVACAYSEYNGTTGKTEWSHETGWVPCDTSGWYRAQVVAWAGTHPSQTFQTPGFFHVCT